MANTYHKILTKKTAMEFTNSLISKIQQDLVNDIRYDETSLINMLNKTNNMDLNTLLKYYTINSLLKVQKEDKNKKAELFEDTANPNYKKSVKDNFYYRVAEDGNVTIDKEVIKINNDGSYKKSQRQFNSRYVIEKTYSVDDNVQTIQLVGPDGRVLSNKAQIAQILEMRKEFAERFKYAGFSGSSRDFVATLCNKFCSPIETGCYMDKNFHLYKWSESSKCFVRNAQLEMSSPLLTDYEFVNSQKVIKKEYIGQ